jgi:hypothetical protein
MLACNNRLEPFEIDAGQSSATMTLRNGCRKAIAVNSQSPKNKVRRIDRRT